MELINYIIPVCNIGDADYVYRLYNVNFILSNFLNKQTNIKVHVIIVEQVIDSKFPTYIQNLKIPEGMDITTITVHYPIFTKPWLYNIAIKRTKSDHFILGESDVYCDKDYLSELISHVERNKIQWCFTWNKAHKLKKGNYTGDFTCISPSRNYCEGLGVYFNRNFWLEKLGGAIELFRELGANDNEIAYRAHQYSGTYVKYPMVLIHLWHPISKLKPNNRVRNSIENNRELRVYVIAKYEAFTDYVKAHETGGRFPLNCSLSQIVSISQNLQQIAKAVRPFGSYCHLSKSFVLRLPEPERSRIRGNIQFREIHKPHHVNVPLIRRIK